MIPEPVSLAAERVVFFVSSGYRAQALRESMEALLEEFLSWIPLGFRVLVKPNLVAPRRATLSCTHPAVVRVVCEWLLERGAEVTVGDSPAFGTTQAVARAAA